MIFSGEYMENNMKLLFITQKIHENDDDLAFTILWVHALITQGISVEVICLEKQDFDNSFTVHSLGKERGVGKIGRIFRFWKLITTLEYDAVFVHMNPEYITLGGWYWRLMQKPIFLWYTHYTMHIHLWIAGKLCTKLFAATPQSMPDFEGNPKKVILGHGIDRTFWKGMTEDNRCSPHKLLTVHRLSKSKRLELVIDALAILPPVYTLDVYGRDVDPAYFELLQQRVKEAGLDKRITFHGAVPMHALKEVYPNHRLMINMAPDTIDKTMLEVMMYGIYPVTTPENSRAIGLPVYPTEETPAAIAAFIQSEEWVSYNTKDLKTIIQERHSLETLAEKLITEMTTV